MNDTKNPTQWLTELLAEIDSFDAEMFPPRGEKEKDEELVGECPAGLRKFYAFTQYCEREIAQAKLDSRFSPKTEHDEIGTRVAILKAKQEVADNIFIGCVAEYFDDWTKEGHLHVRENWAVIRCKKCGRALPSFLDLIRGIEPQE